MFQFFWKAIGIAPITFWNRNPALLYAIAAAIGAFAALQHWAYLFLLLAIPHRLQLTIPLALVTLLTTWGRFELPTHELDGEGKLSIERVCEISSGHKTGFFYQGTLNGYAEGKNIPVSIWLQDSWNRPLANQDYLISGTLTPTDSKRYRFTIAPEEPWMSLPDSFSLAEWRFQAKQWLANEIGRNIQYADSASFLTGIATGEFDNPMLQYEFSRFGLQHIMAISGFHFSLIAAFMACFLRLFLSQRNTTLTLIFFMSVYFIFLGPGPSVLRAFSTMIIALLSSLIGRHTSGVNALGFACLLLIAYDPLLLTTIGFPFSALTTAAILLFYPYFNTLSKKIFKHRFLPESLAMPLLHQHGYTVIHLIRQSLAITCAVNLIAIPLSLFYFQQFPSLSLIYNLFFPFLVSFSMLLLLLALAFPPIAPLLHPANNAFTHSILSLTSNLPTSLDLKISYSLNSYFLIPYLICLLYFAISSQKYIAEKNPLVAE